MKKIPEFKSDQEEQAFWLENDSTDYLDWENAKTAKFPKLKPSTETISLRLPESLLTEIKIMANKNDVPYQSLIKLMLSKQMSDRHKIL